MATPLLIKIYKHIRSQYIGESKQSIAAETLMQYEMELEQRERARIRKEIIDKFRDMSTTDII